ncbi:hypothetical protein OSH39_12680 [Mycobacterium ulcerans]|nr:hypothetical protein [Mycobacterium ulcerans]MEB3905696.1 hypothetical protein [Mycobacterium ulcerans]MEB3909895.1 hypothetical protein [Mycobacterium ulcerans]MEB3920159.1 hypothetical protein [Mycobacterium ulcerans]MEB3924251.1 hypothetical protein [Mycobacterium ulcerans]MEB3928401.1 hypothetical protein [Mycobacterium ulcerans]
MELIEKAPQWDLRFAVPEVCLLEAVADVPREWRKRRSEVAKLAVGEFGLTQSQNEWLDVIDRKIDGYEEALGARLADIEADIVPIPEGVNLRDIVQRAIDRRKPYQEGEEKRRLSRHADLVYDTTHRGCGS